MVIKELKGTLPQKVITVNGEKPLIPLPPWLTHLLAPNTDLEDLQKERAAKINALVRLLDNSTFLENLNKTQRDFLAKWNDDDKQCAMAVSQLKRELRKKTP